MANGHPWFKNYQGDFLGGTNGMPPEQFAVYVRVIMMMYEANGPVPCNERYLAGICCLTVAAFRKALDNLLQLQKLTVCNGELSNERATMELKKRGEISEKRSGAQIQSVKSRNLKSNKNNKKPIANSLANQLQTDLQTNSTQAYILESREEEGKEVHTDLPSSSEKAASLARLESLASPLQEDEKEEALEEEYDPDDQDNNPNHPWNQHDWHCFARSQFIEQREREIRQAKEIAWQAKEAAEEIARKARVAGYKAEWKRDEFLATFPMDGRSSREACVEIFNSLTNIEKYLAIDKIRDLLEWINEAPTDPERSVPTAENWLRNKLWIQFCQKMDPVLAPDARIGPVP